VNLKEFRLLRGNYDYPVWNRAMELCGIFIYAVVSVLLAWEVLQGLAMAFAGPVPGMSPVFFWPLVVAVPIVAYVAADFVSGIVHCAADNFGHERTPIFGTAFIKPFREHHRDPKAITRHDFVESNGNSCIVNLLVLLPLYVYLPVAHNAYAFLAGVFTLAFTLAILGTNQFHKWAHMDMPPNFVRRMQRAGLILRPSHHEVHHTAPFDRYYCITTGWLNPAVEKLGMFEWLVRTFKRP